MACGCSNGGTCNNGCSACIASCAPFYNQAGASQECHEQPVVQQTLVAAISTGTDFIMPACGVEAIVFFYGLTALQVGSYLWNATYGYLRITYFNSLTGETHFINDCLAPNATPGTLVPHCTLFTVTAPTWNACIQCAAGNTYVYVFPAGPPPMPVGDPFSLDIDSIVGNTVYLKWHSVPIVP